MKLAGWSKVSSPRPFFLCSRAYFHSLLRPRSSASTAQQGFETTSAYLDIPLELIALNYALRPPFSPVFREDREALISLLSSAQVLSLHLPFLLRMHPHLKSSISLNKWLLSFHSKPHNTKSNLEAIIVFELSTSSQTSTSCHILK